MVPIERVQIGTLIFLECGCSATRGMSHPTGEAALIVMQQQCTAHSAEPVQVQALRRGTLVSPFSRVAQSA